MTTPTEKPTLAGALEDLKRRGFTAQFEVVGGRLRDVESGQSFGPEEVIIREHRRFEGVSDPSDMAIVYAIETQAGPRGVLVDAFGVYANPEVGAFLESVLPEAKPGAAA